MSGDPLERDATDAKSAFDWAGSYQRLAAWRATLAESTELSAEETTRILQDRARALARPRHEAAREESVDLLIFALGGGRFGVRVSQIEAVVPLYGTTPVPCTPSIVYGVANHRGEILAVLDLRPYVGLPVPEQAAQAGMTVVVEAGDRRFGIFAESLIGIERVAVAKITPMPSLRSSKHENPLEGMTSDMIVLLEAEHLAHDPSLTVNEEID